ncbi:MAG: aspartate dehydrogenase [Mogibacterium sp.]|nr:aspartate dehydrogenase [Mogibacterium sp.]
MGIFGKKESVLSFSLQKFEPVLKCSICTGEQVFCIIDRETREVQELMMVSSPKILQKICNANGISPEDIRRIY